MVIDPLLPQHLAHFGIDILKMEKVTTWKSMLAMKFLKYCFSVCIYVKVKGKVHP